MSAELNQNPLDQNPLGKSAVYVDQYDPTLLFPIERQFNRNELGLSADLPFKGSDRWNGYEFSWLNSQGKPQIGIAQFVFPCTSARLIESKSFKLYLNSFSGTQFPSQQAVESILAADLSSTVGEVMKVKLWTPREWHLMQLKPMDGTCLDDLDIFVTSYQLKPDYLTTADEQANEILYSHLLKSYCPVTGQPDWATVRVSYEGSQISHEGLLKYLISFRQQQEFAEQCVERIFTDIKRQCQPKHLSVYASFTRRGGLDIAPFRTDFVGFPEEFRLARQ